MKLARMWMAVMVVAAALLCPAVVAQEAEVSDDAILALATARAKAEIALRKGRTAMDWNKSGFSLVRERVSETLEKAMGVIYKARDKENRMKRELRDEEFLRECQERVHELSEVHNRFKKEERGAIEENYRKPQTVYVNLKYSFDRLPDLEKYWKAAGQNLTLIVSLYNAIEEGATRAKDQAETAIAEMKEKLTEAQAEIEAAKDFVAGHQPAEEEEVE